MSRSDEMQLLSENNDWVRQWRSSDVQEVGNQTGNELECHFCVEPESETHHYDRDDDLLEVSD